MCGRFTLHSPADVLRRRFEIDLSGVETEPRYNICPSQDVLTVAIGREGEARAVAMRWGFIPFWSEQPSTKLSTINAKVETVEASRMYGNALRRRRCLVLADGFYEWQPGPEGSRRKTPYWIHRSDQAPFAFAGLYSVWRPRDSEGPPLLSCTILTTPASPTIEPIHARMPIILRRENETRWIDRKLEDPGAALALLQGEPDAGLVTRVVSTEVNSPNSEGPELIAAAG